MFTLPWLLTYSTQPIIYINALGATIVVRNRVMWCSVEHVAPKEHVIDIVIPVCFLPCRLRANCVSNDDEQPSTCLDIHMNHDH
jgi:hypothetical protein